MRCPFCGAEDTKVVDSRLANDGDNVRRRRECLTCEERFTTFETAELIMPRIIKGDDRREPFDEEKMRGGMLRALEKRPVAVERIETAINRILHSLHTRGDREVPSKDVGRLVMEQLRDLDDVAYVRFASVYRDFQDASEFREELDRLENEISPAAKEKQLSFLDQEQVGNDKKRRKR